MKYYAVTEDPNELLHYGVKGMKWGQHIFGKERSPGYHRALGKLRISSKKASAPKAPKTSTQKRMTNNVKQQNAYQKALRKEQREIARSEKKYIRELNQERKQDQKIAKALAKMQKYEKASQVNAVKQQARHMKRSLKIDKKFDKVLQQAREGKLRYGKLNEEQIKRVQDRLSMEETARRLGGKEKSSWRQQKKEARQAGKLEGIKRGTSVAIEEVARAGTIYGIQNFMNRRKMNAVAKQEGKEQQIRDRAKNKKTHRAVVNEIKEEAYETRIREGQGIIARNAPFQKVDGHWVPNRPTGASQAKYLKEVKRLQKVSDEQKKLRESDEQLKNDIYRRIVIGGKSDSTETIINRLNDRGAYYNKIFGKELPMYDQPKSKTRPSVRVYRKVKSFVSSSAKKSDPTTHLSKVAKGEVASFEIDSLLNGSGRKRRKYDNPLKG